MLIKIKSRLLEEGKENYIELPEYVLTTLSHINATPVYRNKGIDGFLKEPLNNKPIPIRIQRYGETMMEAKIKLLNATQAKNADLKILIRTSLNDQLLLNHKNDDDMLIIDSYDLTIKNRISNINEHD